MVLFGIHGELKRALLALNQQWHCLRFPLTAIVFQIRLTHAAAAWVSGVGPLDNFRP